MKRFMSPRDAVFFQSINEELINKIVETEITLFKVVIRDSDAGDIYGESPNRKYYTGIMLNCLINRGPQESRQSDFGQNVNQNISCAINRYQLEQKDVYPENGDIIEWNEFYYEVDNIEENQYIAGRQDEIYNWSFVCTGHLTNISYVNIEERKL